MDFTLEETQQAVGRLAAEVLGRERPPVPYGPAAGPAEGYDAALWRELGQAGLLSLALPAGLGGDGLGVMDVAVLLTEVGRHAVAVPALATLALGVLPVVRWGDRALQEALLPGVASGDTVLTAAVRETSQVMPQVPATTARLARAAGVSAETPAEAAGPTADVSAETPAGARGTVSGVKVGVPYAAEADWILIPVSVAPGVRRVVIVETSSAGVSLARTPSAAGQPEYTLRLDQAPVFGVLGADPGGPVVTDLYQLAVAAACCLADGALAGALALTTAHVAAREQFGRPLATFQAVAQQIADVYIASRTLHLAALSACWRLSAGLEAGDDLDVAAYWLAQEAPAALRACHHLHGGLGMDVSYPLHRYSALVRDLARFVGGAAYRLDRLGETAGAGARDGG